MNIEKNRIYKNVLDMTLMVFYVLYNMFVSYSLFYFLMLYIFLKYSLIIISMNFKIKKFYNKFFYNNINFQNCIFRKWIANTILYILLRISKNIERFDKYNNQFESIYIFRIVESKYKF